MSFKGDDEDIESDGRINLMPYFSTTIYSGYGDDNGVSESN